MAATRIISGILREIWQELGQAGGASQVFTTGIRIDPGSLSRVRALLVIDSTNGTVIPVVTADAPNGFLRFAVGFGGNPALLTAWTLDAQLTHSIQQARDPSAGAYVAVVFGAGDDAQTLSQTYDAGLTQDDQTMIVSTAKGGGVIVEASTAAVTAPGGSLEIRQSAAFAVPFVVRRAGDIVGGPNSQFARSRGTIAAPTALQNGDELGTIDYYGYPVNAYTLDARLVGVVTGTGASYGTGFEFHLKARAGALTLTATLDGDGPGSNTVFKLYNSPDFVPSADHAGRIGEAAVRWGQAHIDTVNAYSNVLLGGAALGGGALQTVLLPNTATMPAPQADQVYLGSKDWTGSPFGGIAGATFEVSAEAIAQATIDHVCDTLIPFRYNGVDYVLLAFNATPG